MNGDEPKRSASNSGQADAGWRYKPEPKVSRPTPESQESYATPQNEEEEIVWSASEFVAHQKGAGWFGLLALFALALALIVYILTKDIVSVGIIVFVALLFGVSAARQPRVLHYQLNGAGLTIGQKFYPYHGFKSFTVMQEDAFSSITFVPLKRFMPPISIYYDPEDEERIIEILSRYLPMEHRTRDIVDSFIHRIRF
ncbi:MAG TPA: hypothetical protein VFM05_13685 [Candidatus Saccharimonadales bacterium]|nr:hypothetical protein [Candidatus Saccharimonadales bacterium]